MSDERAAFERFLQSNSIRDLDIDAFADGILGHRADLGFHQNPYGGAEVRTIKRLSWSFGWNERALQHG